MAINLKSVMFVTGVGKTDKGLPCTRDCSCTRRRMERDGNDAVRQMVVGEQCAAHLINGFGLGVKRVELRDGAGVGASDWCQLLEQRSLVRPVRIRAMRSTSPVKNPNSLAVR